MKRLDLDQRLATIIGLNLPTIDRVGMVKRLIQNNYRRRKSYADGR